MMDQYYLDGHKLFWHLDRVAQWQKEKVVAPIYIEVSPVSFCNHKCIFCGIDFAMNKASLDTELFCQRLKEMGQAGVRSVMFAGEGEPLLHRDLPRLVKVARACAMDVSITTNGSLGNFLLWEKLLPHLSWIRFSVDAGTAGVYAQIHNTSGNSFAQTLKSIAEAVAVKKKHKLGVTIGIQYLIIQDNLKDIAQGIELFSHLAVDYFSLKPYSLHPQMLQKKEVVYSEKTISYIEDIISRYQEKTKTSAKMQIIFRKDALANYMDKTKRFNHCRALPFWGYISSAGDFYTCSVFIGRERFRAGNIYQQDMGKIIFGNLRRASISYGENKLDIEQDCRLNCRMARVNEFLEFLESRPEHINFI